MAEFITYRQQIYLKKVLNALAHKLKAKSADAAKYIGCPLPINDLTKQEAALYIRRGLSELKGERMSRSMTDRYSYSVSDYWASVRGRK